MLYVDDGLIISGSKEAMKALLIRMQKKFEIKICHPNYFVGLQISRQPNGSITLSQDVYTRHVVNRFNLQDSKPNTIPADPNVVLQPVINADTQEINSLYREAVGCLTFA